MGPIGTPEMYRGHVGINKVPFTDSILTHRGYFEKVPSLSVFDLRLWAFVLLAESLDLVCPLG